MVVIDEYEKVLISDKKEDENPQQKQNENENSQQNENSQPTNNQNCSSEMVHILIEKEKITEFIEYVRALEGKLLLTFRHS